MTIDDAILYMELYKRKLFDSVSNLEKDIAAYDMAIDALKKLKEIEKITKSNAFHLNPDNPDYVDSEYEVRARYKEICEVIEDGTDIL